MFNLTETKDEEANTTLEVSGFTLNITVVETEVRVIHTMFVIKNEWFKGVRFKISNQASKLQIYCLLISAIYT